MASFLASHTSATTNNSACFTLILQLFYYTKDLLLSKSYALCVKSSHTNFEYLNNRFTFAAMRNFEDTYQHKGLRKKLIDILRSKDITSELVLEAMYNVPRHFFLDSAFDKIAYEDRAFPIDADQTISQPYTVAYQTQLLNVRRTEKILEIGTGSVYQSSVLAEMGAWVYTIERQRKLFDINKNFFFKSKYQNIKFFYGDGFEGLPTYSPFDKILITAAAPFVPPKLVQQLKTNGLMVLPVTEGDKQRMLRITKKENGEYTEEWFDYFSFVPMLKGKNY